MASSNPDTIGCGDRPDGISLVRVDAHDPNLVAVWTLLTELRPQLTLQTFAQLLIDAVQMNLVYEAAILEGKAVALVGWRLVTDSRLGRHVYVADLVVTTRRRGLGLGHAVLAKVVERTRELECTHVVLDSGITNTSAHRFYEAFGFTQTALQFELALN
ncbi:GNAT family N-acetyltransferase [Mycolicibacterium diernhoferi]|uniref:N-acetyltransferase n=1 Tax=Mycolicibacterium diernhoferi TaxID=1801 RepID=A0A2A7NV33_9MYCO|nr:N-acetyltransferase [Mycolicibacterium diernhoferi]